MSCPSPVSGSTQVVLVVPDTLAGQYLWPVRGRAPPVIAADTGPQGCCDCCGVVLQTDVAARVSEGATEYDPTAPNLADPILTVRHVPWVKALFSPQGPCVSNARAYWSDMGRAVGFAAPQGCVTLLGLDPEPADTLDRVQWIMSPRRGEVYGGEGDTVWSIWLRWQIACCACLEIASPRVTYGQVVGAAGVAGFVAPPYATHVTIYVDDAAQGYTISMRDPLGLNVIWSATSTSPIYSLRWPDVERLHIAAAQGTRVVVVWETA